MKFIRLSREQTLLTLILLVGFFLRFYRLGFQSFWGDELHTAIEADPHLSWKELFAYLNCCDQHPPLLFILERLVFALFGISEVTARTLPAIAGTLSIWVMYQLGKEFFSKALGLTAAILTCFNYFHIHYSQEARPYAFLFLFGALSFLYFIRLIRNPAGRTSILYCLFTVLVLYSHYFGLFASAAQAAIALLFVIWEGEQRKLLLKHLVISAIAIVICYLPWLSFLSSMAGIESFWIKPVDPGFALNFFHAYFGDSDLIKPFILLFLILALLRFFQNGNIQYASIRHDPYSFAFIICFLWITVTYLLPYLRSILVIPMLYARYTIVVLPAFIIVLAFGLEGIHNSKIRNTLLTVFCLLSLIDIGLVKRFYTRPIKTQYREIAKLITSDSTADYPFVCGETAWHQQYYLKKYGFSSSIVGGNREVVVDSILKKEGRYINTQGFWLCDALGGEKPSGALTEKIGSSFLLLKEQDFYGAWLQLYVSKGAAVRKSTTLDYHFFPGNLFKLNNDTVVAIWDKTPATTQVQLAAGEYSVYVLMNGTPVKGTYPHMNVLINDRPVHSFYTGGGFTYQGFHFKNERDTITTLKIIMDNDAAGVDPAEDRNAFIKSISFLKVGE
jgi:hypothetical protein